ncbi:MAG: class I SAM-dependent methyltransferase [Candidatus Omnitrophica bacterium]|nr:class I SAM-dependent methyltransferase [Candidatus Omnitrophota bacterium]
MKLPDRSASSVYHYPRYYAIGYQWNTTGECDFLEACLAKYRQKKAHRVLDIGCGAGRHMLELAKRGYHVSGFDLRPEMVEFVKEQARKAKIDAEVTVGNLREVPVSGTFDLAICLMDTFRFLLTNRDIIEHLRLVGERLSPDGLYIADFWIPTQWDKIANEIYQWEQTQEDTTVRVFYVQHPDSIDPVSQTFEDELVFAVQEGDQTQEIQGGRTRTRLIMPQEFQALVEASGVFEIVGTFADFDLDKPLGPSCLSWRMVSILKRRP